MDTPITGMWTELQQQNKLPKGVLSMNCELELQDLMKQIDIMAAGRKRDWEREKEGLQSRLNVREKECLMQKSTLELKHKEIGQLRQQLDSAEKKQRDNVTTYETQLSLLRGEVQKLQREYERLHKRHLKQKKEADREKEKSVLEIQDGAVELQRLNKKVEDYRLRSKEWEVERRAQQKQIEHLESQRKAITDKCEFVQGQIENLETHRKHVLEKCDLVQQQSQTYQTQLDKRRDLLDSTEISLNSQIAQLEGRLAVTQESLQIQNNKVDKLKASLDDAMKSHQKAMDDNEKLLLDLKKANIQNRRLEEQNSELLTELRSRDDFLQMSDEDLRHRAQDVERLELQIAEKDDIIKNLSSTKQKSESDQFSRLRHSLKELQEEARLNKQKEQGLSAENEQLQTDLGASRGDCSSLRAKLEHKKSEVMKLEEEVSDVRSELHASQSRLASLTRSHEAEVQGMRDELSVLTSELHDNSSNVGTLTEKSSQLEKLRTVDQEELEKKDAEMKVGNAQLDALRLENRHLRQTIIQQTQVNLDHTETENNLRGIKESYQNSIKALEQEIGALKEEVSSLQHEIQAMEDRYDDQLRHKLREAEYSMREEDILEQRKLVHMKEDSDRRASMLQDRLDSTINRYEEQLQLLRRQKNRLEDELHNGTQDSFHNMDDVVYREEGVLYINDDMSLADADSTMDGEQFSFEMPKLGEGASEKFLIEEERRTRELEDMIDTHIEQLKSNTDVTTIKQKR